MEKTKNKNPLLVESSNKNRALPFHDIKDEHFLPALMWSIEQAKKEVEKIKQVQNPTFENVILALEIASEDADLVSSTFYNLLSADTNENLQKIAKEFSPLLAGYGNDIMLDDELFQKVKIIFDKKDQLSCIEERKLLEDTYSSFVRNGALLTSEEKNKLRSIDEQLSLLSPQFSENLLKATNAFELLLTDVKDLAGIPESIRDSAKAAAEAKAYKQGWLFNLQYPSFIPFLKYADNRQLREKIWRASSSRAFNDEFDNQKTILKTVQLRHQRAQLLGYKTHAHFVLEKRMAEKPETVTHFLETLLKASKPAAEKDLKELQDFANKNSGPDQLMPWDFSYYSEKLRQEKYNFNEEELRPYFKLENVIDGVFKHSKHLYGLEFKENNEYPVYHSEVKTYDVFTQDNEFIGVLYADLFPRESKQNGAWMTNYYDQGLFKDQVMRPHVAIVCNFTKPLGNNPSLLTFDEVRTLFHEFGHALHGLLSQCKYRSLSGANVYWDFVELPSQILENWTQEKEGLDIFARHFQTNAKIPEDLVQKIKNSSKYMAGYASLRQVSLGLLDMAWHAHESPCDIKDVSEFEVQARSRAILLPEIPESNVSCSFGHIFAGGYSSGYYSYKWAEVLDADAFEFFQEKGIFNSDVATSFKENILSRGGTEHPMELYKKFRGREPDPEALLRRDGLI